MRELRLDPRFAAQPDLMKSLAEMFEVIELEAIELAEDGVPDGRAFQLAIDWIVSQADAIEKRFEALARLPHGKVNLDMRAFYAPQ